MDQRGLGLHTSAEGVSGENNVESASAATNNTAQKRLRVA